MVRYSFRLWSVLLVCFTDTHLVLCFLVLGRYLKCCDQAKPNYLVIFYCNDNVFLFLKCCVCGHAGWCCTDLHTVALHIHIIVTYYYLLF